MSYTASDQPPASGKSLISRASSDLSWMSATVSCEGEISFTVHVWCRGGDTLLYQYFGDSCAYYKNL